MSFRPGIHATGCGDGGGLIGSSIVILIAAWWLRDFANASWMSYIFYSGDARRDPGNYTWMTVRYINQRNTREMLPMMQLSLILEIINIQLVFSLRVIGLV